MKVTLTDLQINRLISGYENKDGVFGLHPSGVHGRFCIDGNFSEYDVIANKSLCFDLMIKHGVMAESINGKIARFVLPFKDKEGKSYYTRFEDEIPQRAIAACIIYKAVKTNE